MEAEDGSIDVRADNGIRLFGTGRGEAGEPELDEDGLTGAEHVQVGAAR